MKCNHLLPILFFFFINIYSQNVNYTELPSHLQLFARDNNDSAMVPITGLVISASYDSIIVEIDTNNVLWRRNAQYLDYSVGKASFSFYPVIYADTVEFSFEIFLKHGSNIISDTLISSVVCGDAYLIYGQSNARASDYDGLATYTIKWIRSFGTSSTNPVEVEADTVWYTAQGNTSSTSGAIGVWGMKLGELISQNYGVPLCFINGAKGSEDIKDLRRNYRDPINLSFTYGRLLYRILKADLDQKIKAVFWWQGESDIDPNRASQYTERFKGLYRDLYLDFPNIKKIYTTQIHTQNYGDAADTLREVQRSLIDSLQNLDIMTSFNIGEFGRDNSHHGFNGYNNYAKKIFKQLQRDIHGSTDTLQINPPNIKNIYFTGMSKSILILEFHGSEIMDWNNDTTIASKKYFLKDHFYFHNSDRTIDTALIDTAMVFNNKVRLSLIKTSNAVELSYLPTKFYNGSSIVYDGPWLMNSRNIAALSFYRVPIDSDYGDDPLPVSLSNFIAEVDENTIRILWRTESEIENMGFILYKKSLQGNQFREIASYQYVPTLRGHGNSNKANNYSYIDYNVSPGNIYYYILEDVDFSGTKSVHGPIEITMTEKTIPSKTELFQNFPNPFNPFTTILFTIPVDQLVVITVYDILGQKVDTIFNEYLPAGNHKMKFEAKGLD